MLRILRFWARIRSQVCQRAQRRCRQGFSDVWLPTLEGASDLSAIYRVCQAIHQWRTLSSFAGEDEHKTYDKEGLGHIAFLGLGSAKFRTRWSGVAGSCCKLISQQAIPRALYSLLLPLTTPTILWLQRGPSCTRSLLPRSISPSCTLCQ